MAHAKAKSTGWLASFLTKLRSSGAKPPRLTIELVPETCWVSNVRSNISEAEWDRIRKLVAKEAQHRCEICGGVGPRHPVECHEIWHYDDEKRIQTLKGLIALCPPCHEVKHIGLATLNQRGNLAEEHLARVNGWTAAQAKAYVKMQFQIWEERSRHPWQLDMEWLTKHGITFKTTDRKAASTRKR